MLPEASIRPVSGARLAEKLAPRPSQSPVFELFSRIGSPRDGDVIGRRWLDVRGWALDSSGTVREVLIEIDGREVTTARQYLPRMDVNAAYPAIPGARTSGWLARVDLARIDDSRVKVTAIAVTREAQRVELDVVEVELSRTTRPRGRSEHGQPKRPTSIAVYTAIFGGYDELQPQPSVQGVDFICFTDDPLLSVPPWSVKPIAPRHPDPRIASRWPKLFPHRVLPRHRFTVYVDGSIRLRSSDSITRLLSILKGRSIALFPHPDRDSTQQEAEASLEMNKYEGLPLREQVSS